MSCKVSVIIPYYNHLDYILITIDSVLNQSFNDFELIVVNDGSPCNGHEQLKEYSQLKNFTYIYQDNSGVSSALNLGIKKAKGEYVALIGSDDVMMVNRLEVQYRIMSENSIDGLATYVERIDENGLFINDLNPKGSGFLNFNYFFSTDFYFPAPSAIYRKSKLMSVGLFDTAKSIEDWSLWLKLAEANAKLYLHDEILTQYRVHESASSNDIKMFSGICDILVEYRKGNLTKGLYIMFFNYLKGVKNLLKKNRKGVLKLTSTLCYGVSRLLR